MDRTWNIETSDFDTLIGRRASGGGGPPQDPFVFREHPLRVRWGAHGKVGGGARQKKTPRHRTLTVRPLDAIDTGKLAIVDLEMFEMKGLEEQSYDNQTQDLFQDRKREMVLGPQGEHVLLQ